MLSFCAGLMSRVAGRDGSERWRARSGSISKWVMAVAWSVGQLWLGCECLLVFLVEWNARPNKAERANSILAMLTMV